MSDHIPFEIQVDIIKRLPVQSLLQFRSVSKPWKSFIDSSKFIADYNKNVCRLFISYKYKELDQNIYDYYHNDISPNQFISIVDDETFLQPLVTMTLPGSANSLTDSIVVVGSCHGLFCLYGSNVYSKTMMAIIWNPTIRKSVAIDVPDVYGRAYEIVLGFAVCPSTLDPKIIKLPHNTYFPQRRERISCILMKVKVFTLTSGAWRSPCGNLPRKSIGFEKSQVVIDGFIYWLAYDRIINTDDDVFRYDNLIISFDLTSEEFREVHLPENLLDGTLSISKLRESFVVLEYYQETGKEVCGVWMMGHGVPKLFTKLYTVNKQDISFKTILGFTKNGASIIEVQDSIQDDSQDNFVPDTIVIYEPDSKNITETWIYGKENTFFVHSYMETLLLLNQQDHNIHIDKDKGHVARRRPKKRCLLSTPAR